MEEGEQQHGRMVKLSGALTIALEKSLRRVTLQAFCACFPKHLVAANPELFKAAHENYVEILRANIQVSTIYFICLKLFCIKQCLYFCLLYILHNLLLFLPFNIGISIPI